MSQTGTSVIDQYHWALVARRFSPRTSPLWFERVRYHLHALRIRLFARWGYVVVVVGRCGSGKTVLLEKALPGRIVSPDIDLLSRTPRKPLDEASLPAGLFGVDEAAKYDWAHTRKVFPGLSERKAVFTVQSVGQIFDLGLDQVFRGRLLVYFLGSRDELREQCRMTPFSLSGSVLRMKIQRSTEPGRVIQP